MQNIQLLKIEGEGIAQQNTNNPGLHSGFCIRGEGANWEI